MSQKLHRELHMLLTQVKTDPLPLRESGSMSMCRQRGWGMSPGTSLPCRTDDQVARIVAVNGTHRPPDALEPLMCGLGLTETSRHQMSPNVYVPTP